MVSRNSDKMKKFLSLLFLFTALYAESQILPFQDYTDFLKVFYKGQARQLELQRVNSYAFGDHILAYLDNRNDLRYYDGENIRTATNMIVNYKVSDTYLAYKISNGLFYIENGQPKNLCMFTGNFIVKDSLILFEDTQYNTWNVVHKGRVRPLYQSTGTLASPAYVGENIIAFKDNGDVYRIFHNGTVYEFGVWMSPIEFAVGTDIACFNDPTMNSFAVFEKGEFMDVEPQFAKSYKSGKDFIVYLDINGNLMYYSKGKKQELSSFPTSYDVIDDAIIFTENNYSYTFYQGERKLLCNYIPKDYLLKNKVICFRNIMGGVSAFVDGKVVELTTQQDSEYVISGNYVMVSLFNRSYLIYADGKIYNF